MTPENNTTDSSVADGSGKTQYCPRCGFANFVPKVVVSKCKGCTWKVVWVGPLWGVA